MNGDVVNVPPPMQQLPDGIGLDHEQVAQLLAEKSKTIVSPDDPVLMLVTLLNAFLAEENKLLERHKEALTHVLAARTDKFVGSVESVATELGRTLSASTLAGMQTTFAEHKMALAEHKAHVQWLSAIAAGSALVNVLVFVALFLLKR
ncbi:MAG: hypothetical protein FWD79_10850 [Desulfobulbus sp.]|nr:hypothetical protein [Desulfobulbus sp.]